MPAPTPVSLKDAFGDARDRIKAITKLGLPELAIALTYSAGARTNTPYGEIVIPSVQFPALSGGQQTLLFTWEVRINCGKAAEGSDGQLQEKITFDWLPRLCETFTKYGRLAYPDKPQYPHWLDSSQTKVQRAQVILDQNWWMVFYWQVAFKTQFICM